MHLRRVLVSIALPICSTFLSALTFSDWQAANFTPGQLGNETVSGAMADPDVDGMANLHEYVFLGAPLIPEPNLAPSLELVGSTMALTYRERHGMTDVDIRLQGSDTLMNWITYNTVTEADLPITMRSPWSIPGFSTAHGAFCACDWN